MAELSPRNRTYWIIASIVIVVILLFALFYRPSYDWYQHSYDSNDKEPYGADLGFKYLKALRSDGKFISLDSTIASNLKGFKDTLKGANYVVLGYLPYMDSLDTEHLFEFVASGNNAFLFCGSMPAQLLDRLHQSECVVYTTNPWEDDVFEIPELDSIVKVNFFDSHLRLSDPFEFGHRVQDQYRKFFWPCFPEEYLCEDNTIFQKLGSIDEQVNFIRVDYEEGSFFWHTNPKLFTNYYLTLDEGRAYTQSVFSYLGEGPILWDDKKWKAVRNRKYYSDRYSQNEGPLSYILSQESLKWALYLIFLGVGLFVLFATRRKQRAIPVIVGKENSSLEYVETISSLYYNKKGDGRIFQYLSDQFTFFIRERYRIMFKWEDERTWAMLAKASGVSESHIRKMVEMRSKGSYAPNVDEDMLIKYNGLLEAFHSKCK